MSLLGISLLLLLAQNASVEGVVVQAGSNNPLSKARIELHAEAEGAPALDSITTEADGRFVFPRVPSGRLRLTVTRPGYFRRPLTVTVANGQPAAPLQLSMVPTGAISGHIYDDAGQPLGNIEVQALKATYPAGRRVLTFVQSVQTDDLGEYRLFWLPPGRYYLAAVPPGAGLPDSRIYRSGGFGITLLGGPIGIFLSSVDGDPAVAQEITPAPFGRASNRYVPIYFGGTSDEQSASAIDVRAGADLTGVNIVMFQVREHHVRGAIVDGNTGQPAQNARVNDLDEMTRPVTNFDGFGRVASDPGAFDILLVPGLHTLVANSASGTGSITVRMGDADLDNITIPTLPTFNISGRVSLEGKPGSASALGELRISLEPDPPPVRMAPAKTSYGSPIPNGSFALDGQVGNFRVNVAPILNVTPSPGLLPVLAALQDVYVKSIRLGDVDVLNGGLRLERAPTVPLEIVLGTSIGAVEGSVADNQQRAAVDISVVLIPDTRRRFELYRTAATDPMGHFRFDRVPPGDYKIFAWTEVEDGDWFDPEFIRNYENSGTPVRVGEASTATVRVVAIGI